MLIYLALNAEQARLLGFDEELPRLEGRAQIERWQGAGHPPTETVFEALQRAEVVITGWGTPMLSPLHSWSPEDFAIRLLAHSAGTVKYLLPFEAVQRGLLVTHANESLAEAVAEFTIGAIIMARRQAFAAHERMRVGKPDVAITSQRELAASTIGIIAASAIGRRVLRLLQGFGARLLLSDPYCSADDARALGAELVSLPELLRQSDIVSLHAPVTGETVGMLGAAEFALMQDGALFVNTARGRLIDANALLAELQSGRLDALLDVTDPQEPLPLDSPFFRLENCVLLPHMAACTLEARKRQARYTVDEIERFLDGQALRFQVTAAKWATMA